MRNGRKNGRYRRENKRLSFQSFGDFDASKEDTLGDAFKYYIILLLIPALLSAVIAVVAFSLFAGFFGRMLPGFMPALLALAGAGAAVAFIAVFIYMLIAGTIGVLIDGLWLHIWVYLVVAGKA